MLEPSRIPTPIGHLLRGIGTAVPEPRANPILVLGATGFVGRRVTEALLARGHPVRALVRPHGTPRPSPPGLVRVTGDLLDPSELTDAFKGAGTVYYLVHSMASRDRSVDFAHLDRQIAYNTVRAATRAGVERIIYVGGLGRGSNEPSPHLESRQEVEEILASGSPSLTTLRAAIILGAGGASFEMMVQLVERLPAMICPQWIRTRCQPIALDDLVEYLVGCLFEPQTSGRGFDVGGPDVLPYYEMLHRIGDRLGARSWIISTPFLTPRLSSHWVGFITTVSAPMARLLVDGMSTEVTCRENEIRKLVDVRLHSFDEALDLAFADRPLRPLSMRQHLAGLPGGGDRLVSFPPARPPPGR